MLNVDFWQGRYDEQNTPWDLGGASPHFEQLLAEKPDFLKPGRMAVPGAGRGHDAALFAKAGFDVVGFDYAPGAITEARRLYGDIVRFEQADIFELANPESEWAGQFDYWLEHTCFCAISPKLRRDYGKTAANLIKSGGYLIGIFWQHGDWGGPPYSTTEADLRHAFEPEFEVVSLQQAQAAADREGFERLAILRRR